MYIKKKIVLIFKRVRAGGDVILEDSVRLKYLHAPIVFGNNCTTSAVSCADFVSLVQVVDTIRIRTRGEMYLIMQYIRIFLSEIEKQI